MKKKNLSKQDCVRVACDIFVTRGNKLLMGKRKNCYGAGTWALPGGHLEIGEKMIDGAKRELNEELAINGVDLKLVAITDYLGEFHYIHIAFWLKDYEGACKLNEPEKCEKWKFFDLEKLPDNIFDSHLGMIEAFKKKETYLY